jgi:hypothetical protein
MTEAVYTSETSVYVNGVISQKASPAADIGDKEALRGFTRGKRIWLMYVVYNSAETGVLVLDTK